ncbi:MAG: EamA family transporter RarD [Myxococcota bacterium]
MPARRAESTDATAGLAYGVAAYTMWGLAPLFWRMLSGVPASELLAHRLSWAWVFFVAWLAARRDVGGLRTIAASATARRRLAASAMLLATNWFVFVYAVLTERVLDASLGYFINPIVSVALGRLVLGEQMRPLQSVAVAIAVVGIAIATWLSGGLPWIAVVLASSFAVYGLIRKTTKVDPLAGSAFETTLLLPLGVGVLVWIAVRGGGAMGHTSIATHGLLIATGLVTALPLLAFVYAAVRVRLTTLGFIQYLAPSLQFALAALFFDEALPGARFVAFACVWLALLVFGFDAWRARPRSP